LDRLAAAREATTALMAIFANGYDAETYVRVCLMPTKGRERFCENVDCLVPYIRSRI
jgi:hypothetical protein